MKQHRVNRADLEDVIAEETRAASKITGQIPSRRPARSLAGKRCS